MNCCEDKKDTCGDSQLLNMGRGCEFCRDENGEAHAKVCDGCFKLHVTDWLGDYPANLPDDIVEVRFKNTRRSYYQNVNKLPLKVGDIVAVEASPGHDIGIVSLVGDMVPRQMKRVDFHPMNGEFKKVYRKAKPYDIEKWQEAIALEHETMIRSRQIAAEMNLNMKIGDVEYQGDKIKAIFYYIADERVDFRELIKVFADVFRIRVEMKQIGARQEAGRIGGLGACGRELCCASWISSFMSVTTNAARTQDISLNPQKLAGQCSKLKCCLVYEYDDYMDARKEFPRVNGPLQALDGDYYFVKNDILARTMSFSTDPHSMVGTVVLPIEKVREIMKLNARGVKPDQIESERFAAKETAEPGFINVIGEDSITRFDSQKKKKGKGGGRGRGSEQRAEGRGGDRNGQPKADARSDRNGQPKSEARSDKGGQPKGEARSDKGGQPKSEARPDRSGRGNGKQGGERQQGDRPRNARQGGDRPQGERQQNSRREGGDKQRQQGGGDNAPRNARPDAQNGQGGEQKPRQEQSRNNNRRGQQNRRGPKDGQNRERQGGEGKPEPKKTE